jgi:CheY-like chemotaxis protein
MQSTETDKKLLGKTILVAEDVEMNQHLIRQILESSGARVVIARNGAEALELVKKQIFDCILMNVQMPEMDGVQYCDNGELPTGRPPEIRAGRHG